MTAGDIYTVAGGGIKLGDGGPGTQAELSNPSGVALDAAGNVAIGDSTNERIRVLAATRRFYGQAMTTGDIYNRRHRRSAFATAARPRRPSSATRPGSR